MAEHLKGVISTFSFEDKQYRFFVANEQDSVQRYHYAGYFYEGEDLEVIRRHVGSNKICTDIGTNVGNHAIFFASVMQAKEVVVLEPNPVARAILEVNIALNPGLPINTKLIEYALGDESGTGHVETRYEHNLGLGVLKPGEGTVKIARGDDLLDYSEFLKIDVEGFEMKVLAGLPQLIAKHHPMIYIEVDNSNLEEFNSWIQTNNYRIIERVKRYEVNENFLIV